MMKESRLLALVAATLAATVSSAATFVLDDPNPIVARPLSGTATYALTGTITTVGNESISNYGGASAFNADETVGIEPVPDDTAFTVLRQPGSSYTGTLFTFDISADTPLGEYATFTGLPNGPVLNVGYFTNGVGSERREIQIPWSVTVQAVPEPGTMAVLGLGAAALLRKRRKARTTRI